MSVATPAATMEHDDDHVRATVMHPTKSFRRKYRKIMVKFEDGMRASNTLFRDHARLQDVRQRLAEQTDQLLDLLAELNDAPQVPSQLRFNLKDDTNNNQQSQDLDEVARDLRKARHKVRRGEISQAEYKSFSDSLLAQDGVKPELSYQKLSKTYNLSPPKLDTTTAEPDSGVFLTDKQKEEYLASLDAHLDNPQNHVRAHARGRLGFRHAERSAERERELQIANPMSVYNWLRRHQPQVFLQDQEHDRDKARSATHKSAKKSVSSKEKEKDKEKERVIKQEVEKEKDMYDEDGIALFAPENKSKRKRDDDGGFRPKGGSSKPNKKRRIGNESAGSSKRASVDIREGKE